MAPGGDVTAVAGPVGVEVLVPRPVDSLVGVGTEIVTLGLDEVGGKSLAPVGVVESEGRRVGRDRDAGFDRRRYHSPPARLGPPDGVCKKGIEEKVV